MNYGYNSECDQLVDLFREGDHVHDHLWDETEDNKFLWALSHYDETWYTLFDHLDYAVADEDVTTQLEKQLENMLNDDEKRDFFSALTSDTQQLFDEFHVDYDLDNLQNAIDHAEDTSHFMEILDGFWQDGNHEDDAQFPHGHETNWSPEEVTSDVWDMFSISDVIDHTNDYIDD